MTPNTSDAATEMPRYQCHKIVHALKIKTVLCHAHRDPAVTLAVFVKMVEFAGATLFFDESGYAPIPVSADWYRKHEPSPGGYYVVYGDGYASYSPGAAFEAGYARI